MDNSSPCRRPGLRAVPALGAASVPCRVQTLRAQSARALLPALLVSLAALSAACGGGDSSSDAGASCTKSSQCAVGEGCDTTGHCVALPCGGCQPDQVCQDSGTCALAQGAKCPAAGCPKGYTCNKNNVCSLPCLRDRDCGDPSLVCNPNTGTCAQCVFDSQCTAVAGKPRCDPTSGNCVACLQPIDCSSGHFCEQATHLCQTGCKASSDCNLSAGERCDGATASAPGRCVQCTADADCSASPATPACDVAKGRCVGCAGDKYCNQANPRCDPVAQLCVQCLPVNNASGSDCGYPFVSGGPKDPHNAMTCDPTAKQCVPGCATDAQCGCPKDPGTGNPTNCARLHTGGHCDPTLKTMPGFTPPLDAEGGCVECTQNTHCKCKVKGVTTANTPECDANWPQLGLLNGARCVRNATTSYGECVEGCDSNADCPAGRLCGASGTQNAHKCVDCSCAAGTIVDNAWCNNPLDPNNPLAGGCGLTKEGYPLVCDSATLLCRLKRQSEVCDSSRECGDTKDPTVGQCVPGAKFCVKSSHGYLPNSPQLYCDPGKLHGRCGIACSDPDPNVNACTAGIPCPNGSACHQSTSLDTPPSGNASGQYCVSNNCKTP